MADTTDTNPRSEGTLHLQQGTRGESSKLPEQPPVVYDASEDLRSRSRSLLPRDHDVLESLTDRSWIPALELANNHEHGPALIGYSHEFGIYLMAGSTLIWTSKKGRCC